MGPALGGGPAARSPPGSLQWADTERKVADLGGHRGRVEVMGETERGAPLQTLGTVGQTEGRQNAEPRNQQATRNQMASSPPAT